MGDQLAAIVTVAVLQRLIVGQRLEQRPHVAGFAFNVAGDLAVFDIRL